MKKVSLIIPVFNLEAYLAKTLNSVTNQSYQNLEIILVDDHSHDQSLALAKQWAQKDTRIKVLALPSHQGVSKARNQGLKLATGELISFVDGDDQLAPTFIQTLVAHMHTDVAAVAVGYQWGARFDRATHQHRGKSETLSRAEFYASVNSFGDPIGGYIWNKLFRKAVIDQLDLHFDETLALAEDLWFVAEYIAYAPQEKFIFDPTSLYDKISRPGSIIHTADRSMRQKEQLIRQRIDRLGEKVVNH